MTVAAVILAATPASALADADGTPAARRAADTAWAGGATPVVVVAHELDGRVGQALATIDVTLADPAPRESGPVGQILRGMDVAAGLVAGTEAALVWPARMAWVDAETVTTLIAAHGADRGAVLRPAWSGQAGWPALVPLAVRPALGALATHRMPDDLLEDLAAAGVAVVLVESGDPGTVFDVSVARASLPPFDGPPEPADAHAHEWGAAAADEPDEADLASPERVAYPVDPPGSR